MTAKIAHREVDRPDTARDAAPERGVDATVVDAVVNRRSIRRFRPTPIPSDMVTEILSAASRAPSGTNFQDRKSVV